MPSPLSPSGSHHVCCACDAASPAVKPWRAGLSADWMRPTTSREPRPFTEVDTTSSRCACCPRSTIRTDWPGITAPCRLGGCSVRSTVVSETSTTASSGNGL